MGKRPSQFDPTGVGTRLRQLAMSGALAETPMVDIGRAMREQLEFQTLPAWCRNTRDRRYGGFRIGARERAVPRHRRRGRVPGKQIVSQSRMIWGLAWAHRHGISPRGCDPIARACDGYRFMQRHLRDPIHGGYFWRVTRSGEVENDLKVLYGQAFVIFALVELSRASGDRAPLEDAVALWRVVMDRLHDAKHGGWTEHGQRDWSPPEASREVVVESAGHKSADAHLHWMEALTELCAETGDPAVARSLEEVVDLLLTYIFPPDPADARALVTRDWQPVSGSRRPISLGHNVEFARLALAAEEALGRQPSMKRFESYLDHALEAGFDHVRGGLDTHPSSADAPDPGERIWWVQAELLGSLAEAVARTGEGRFGRPLRQQLRFVLAHHVDPTDGLWWATVDGNGLVTRPIKHDEWKAGYHELRAVTIMIERSTTRG